MLPPGEYSRLCRFRPGRMKQPRSTVTADPRRDLRTTLLDVTIGALGLLVVVLAWSFLSRTVLHPPVDPVRSGSPSRSTIQLDILNGCGAPGAGTAMTAFLRARGFDVVEYRNYRSFDVQETLVIDRAGNRENAEKVAYALGVAKGNIIEQINEDYYVDVSVLLGRDFVSLKSSH